MTENGVSDDKKRDTLKEMYKQYWQHARHQEWQRSTFTATYTVAIGAVLGFLAQKNLIEIEPITGILIMLFLSGLSLIGFFIVMKWSITMWTFGYLADNIAKKLGDVDEKYLVFVDEDLKKDTFFKIFSKIRASHTFMAYYSSMTAAFITSVYSWFQEMDNVFYDWKMYLIFASTVILLMAFYFTSNSKTTSSLSKRFN